MNILAFIGLDLCDLLTFLVSNSGAFEVCNLGLFSVSFGDLKDF